MTRTRSRLHWLLTALLLLSIALTACQAAPPTAEQVVITQQVEVTREVDVEVTRQVDVEVTRQVDVTAAPGALPYGLLPDKPFAGTKLKFLICCQSAAQFFLLNQKSLAFTELTGIEVEWGNVPFGEFQTLTQQEGATGAGGWDLVSWVDVWGPGLFNTVEPLDAYIERDGYDIADFPEAYLAPGRNNEGQTVGIPFRGHAFTLFYRQDLYDQLGLEVPETWAELEANATAIQDATGVYGLAPYYAVAGGQNMFLWQSLLWSNGGDLFDADWKPIFNSPEGVEATQRYVDWLLADQIAPPGSVDFNEQAGQVDLSQGRSAQFIGWSWMYGNFINPTLTITDVVGNVGFAPVPAWEGKGEPATYGYIWEVGIYKNSPNKDAAWEYLKWLTHPENEKRVALDQTDPRFINVVVVHKSTMSDPEINELYDGLQQNMLSVLDNARSLPMLPEWLQVQAILEVAINEMANGAPVQETLDRAAEDVEALLAQAGYY